MRREQGNSMITINRIVDTILIYWREIPDWVVFGFIIVIVILGLKFVLKP
jgi:hypothetical protein